MPGKASGDAGWLREAVMPGETSEKVMPLQEAKKRVAERWEDRDPSFNGHRSSEIVVVSKNHETMREATRRMS